MNPHLQASIYGVRNQVHAEETRQNRLRLQQATCAAGAGDKVEFDARLLEVLGRTAAASAMMFMLSIEAGTEDPGSAIIIVPVRFSIASS